MKIDNKKYVLVLLMSFLFKTMFAVEAAVQVPGTQQTIIVQLQNQNDSSLEKQIEFSLNNILPGLFKGVVEGASLAAGATNGFGKLPDHDFKEAYPLLTEGVISGVADIIREDEDELCKRDEGYVPYLTEKGIENFSKYLVGLLLISQCGDEVNKEQRAAFLTEWVNSLCRGQEFTRGKILKFLLTVGTRGMTEGLSINKDNQVRFSVIDSASGVFGGLVPELAVKYGLDQKNKKGRIATRVLSSAMTLGFKVASNKLFDAHKASFEFDLCKINEILLNTKVVGGTALVSGFMLFLIKNGIRPKDILDMIKVVKEIGPTIQGFVGF